MKNIKKQLKDLWESLKLVWHFEAEEKRIRQLVNSVEVCVLYIELIDLRLPEDAMYEGEIHIPFGWVSTISTTKKDRIRLQDRLRTQIQERQYLLHSNGTLFPLLAIPSQQITIYRESFSSADSFEGFFRWYMNYIYVNDEILCTTEKKV